MAAPVDCSDFKPNRPVYLDIVISPKCSSLNDHLVTATIDAMRRNEESAAKAGTSVQFSVASIGSGSVSPRTPDVLFASSVQLACVQSLIPEGYFSSTTSPYFDYLKCSQGISSERGEPHTNSCFLYFDEELRGKIGTCTMESDMFALAKEFAESVPDELFPELPLLYIDGKRYCGYWSSDDISAELCKRAAEPRAFQVRPRDDSTWPTPRVKFDFTQECQQHERFPGDQGRVCFNPAPRGGVLVELVPVIGLLFLIISAFTLACLVIFRRRIRQRTRLLQRQQRTLEAAQNERILDIMQFLALITTRDDAVDPERHREEVQRHLDLLRTKSPEDPNSDLPICTVCLDPVDVFYDLPCSHKFHKECLKAWLDKGKTDCPVCRHQIVTVTTPFNSRSQAHNSPESANAIGRLSPAANSTSVILI